MPELDSKTKPICTSIAGAADLIGVVPLTISRLIKAKKLRASRALGAASWSVSRTLRSISTPTRRCTDDRQTQPDLRER